MSKGVRRTRSTVRGEEYAARFESCLKWINQCVKCQARGLKPETPKPAKPTPDDPDSAVREWNKFKNLHEFFPILDVDGDGLCEIRRLEARS